MLVNNRPIINREFILTQKNFDQVVLLIHQLSGISLSIRKVDMVYSRLSRRLRQLKISNFDSYLDLVNQDQEEKVNFVNALTTNLTHFFRERHHFDYLIESYLPELILKKQKRIRFWSAGCSTGEEAYTLSMVWESLKENTKGIDFKILATDLDTKVLDKCHLGIFDDEKLTPIEEKYLKWFKKTSKCSESENEINPALKEKIYFKQLNLMDDWPMKGPLDLIICRNVLIYFDKKTQKELVNRFHGLLSHNGCLMLGHSENLSANKNQFDAIGKTIYRKI